MRKRLLSERSASTRARLALALCACAAVALLLSSCGSSFRDSDDARADVDVATPGSCAATVLDALGHVATRVYREGVSSERTASATRMIESSAALRTAVEEGNAAKARAAGRALIATGHMTNLRVVRAGKVLVDLGGPALTPLGGTLTGAGGKPIASFVTSVWADGGLIAETNGIAEATTLLRSEPSSGHAQTLAGAFALPDGALPAQGTLERNGVTYQFTSYAARAYPAGEALRVFLLRSIESTVPLCGASEDETTVNTLSRIARLIYEGEAGRRTLTQIGRVQQNAPLLQAVAKRDKTATRTAVQALLHQHIVRLRVSSRSKLLADVGGPYVLAPVTAPLRLHGRTIGSFVLSIQDDEGYKRLANRLAGLDVLMYMGSRLVKSTIGASPGPIPASGPVSVHGKSYRAYTFTAKAFPSGPLRITVLIPLPYS
ncbi:MAG TPA: hypothetical protein VG188_04450 [Solirubrobacteraceae bacterium]|nr:hypothetical protein [Solirubrobacteraceae bacterium]